MIPIRINIEIESEAGSNTLADLGKFLKKFKVLKVG
jgi:hypothetical protein